MGGAIYYALTESSTEPSSWQTFNGSIINLENSTYLWFIYNTLTDCVKINSKTGWKIDYNGNAEFRGNLTANKGVFYDDCIFIGSIASGPLYVDEENPTNIKSQQIFNTGESTERLWNAVKNLEKSTAVNGIVIYNNTSYGFSHVKIIENGSDRTIALEDKKLNMVNWTGKENEELYAYGFIDIIVNGEYQTLKCDITLNLYNPTGKTFKLIDLPTSAASENGYVYRDSENYLRIS